MQSEADSELAESAPGIAAVVLEIAVDGSVQGGECRHEQDDDAAGRQDRSHGSQSPAVVFDVFEHVEANTRVRLKAGQCGEFRAARFADQRVQVGLIRETVKKGFDATGLYVERDNEVAIEQHAGEIAESAAHFYHPAAEFGNNEPALPGEVVDCLRHALLICYGVSQNRQNPYFKRPSAAQSNRLRRRGFR